MAEPKPEQLKVNTHLVRPGIWAIDVVGSIDFSNLATVKAAIEDIFKRGVYRLVVDLEKVSYIASSGFGFFLTTLDTAKENGGHIVFVATPPDVGEIFRLLGLFEVLSFAADLKSAIAQFEG